MTLMQAISRYLGEARRAFGAATIADAEACDVCSAASVTPPATAAAPEEPVAETAVQKFQKLVFGEKGGAMPRDYSDETFQHIQEQAISVLAERRKDPSAIMALLDAQRHLLLIAPVRALDFSKGLYEEFKRNYIPATVQIELLRGVARIATSSLAASELGLEARRFLFAQRNDHLPASQQLYDSTAPLESSGTGPFARPR